MVDVHTVCEVMRFVQPLARTGKIQTMKLNRHIHHMPVSVPIECHLMALASSAKRLHENKR